RSGIRNRDNGKAMKEVAAKRNDIFTGAVNAMAAQIRRPVLYGPDNRPLMPHAYTSYSRKSAKRHGSMSNWIPKRLIDHRVEAAERHAIVERSIDLTQNDPHAAGIVSSFATSVVGVGLSPQPTLNPEILGFTKERVRKIAASQRAIYASWSPFADAGERMTFEGIQFLLQRNLIQYGEFILLPVMVDDPARPYSLACQVVNPLRLKTPVDKKNDTSIRDGIELGPHGQPLYYWIKKSHIIKKGKGAFYLPDTSDNFHRIPAKKGHRWQVIHCYVNEDAEQVRGMPYFAPAMKFFRDLNDYLDAELVSNIVTAAFSLFIEQASGTDTDAVAQALASFTQTRNKSDGTSGERYYQEIVPGQIMYGNAFEKPHAIAANRPGQTFEPFTKVIKKAIASSINVPYVVLFKDVSDTNFAGFRSAMLDAWRVYMHFRTTLGRSCLQKIWTMLMEEAYLRGDLKVQNFYTRMWNLTKTEWRGAPKGDIEPVKETTSDIKLNENNMKSLAQIAAERGTDLETLLDQLEEEKEMLQQRGLMPAVNPPDNQAERTDENADE
ncbi:MAG: phage portal protein, partial [Deltaproteobacteria bacterium]|nr:phage portal protein [Deltaproteobacteria bacterium]